MNMGAGIRNTILPKGFYASGINCGVRRYRPDLGLIYSDSPMSVVGVFTQNTLKAAPIKYCQQLLPSTDIRALVVNSGQANAATGLQGEMDNLAMVKAIAAQLKCSANQVISASTGVIGQPMEIEKIIAGSADLVKRASPIVENFATAILTTDLVPKTISTKVKLSTGTVSLVGICKGSGMIHPNMATMLGFFITDLQTSTDIAQTMLKEVTDESFNMISVDADPSTNDCAFMMSNGTSEVSIVNDSDYYEFKLAMKKMAVELAKSIARDGEGATKLIEARICGAPNQNSARNWARSLVMSPLVKTAINGEDPNWGRILAKLGSEGVPAECFDKLRLYLQTELIFENGCENPGNIEIVKAQLRQAEIKITVELNHGHHSGTAWGCDLSKKYVEINAEYTT